MNKFPIRGRSIVLALAMALATGCSPSASRTDLPLHSGAGADSPNLVLIVIDTFRPDHLGTFGYSRMTAPFLEELVERGTTFANAFSTSTWTAPSTSSLFTSLYPNHHGVTEGFLAHKRRARAVARARNEVLRLNQLPKESPTLPEILQRAGYRTQGVTSNINIGPKIGFDRGFERFRQMTNRTAEDLAAQIEAWQHDNDDPRPTFTYLHFNDVHEPYTAHAPWFEKSENELETTVSAYDSQISYLDGVLDRLYHDLEWERNTLVVIVSDHGEEFMEHGRMGHQLSLHHELMRVLMSFSGSDVGVPSHGRINVNVSLIDIMPTLLDLLNLTIPSDLDGDSLSPLLDATASAEEEQPSLRQRTLFAHRSADRFRSGQPEVHLWAAIKGPWKLIEKPSGPRLFNLVEDPLERINLAERKPVILAQLREELQGLKGDGFSNNQTLGVEIDEETLETLRSLGYVQ
ncbi:MAG: sulfatase-like hydrolase/transferase [Thermoanaerobaculia bacterium]|nr:sulfatase-like hydrolase/transferase [Thermoanaerobaculia bacterium]